MSLVYTIRRSMVWRHALRGAVIILLAIQTTGCDAIYRMIQKEGAEERDILGELMPYERNARVAEVQQLLKLYGYRIGSVDGVLGANTRNAIAAFQEDCELPVSRFVDYATWECLHRFEQSGLIQDGELNVLALQKALKASGVDPGPVDGKQGAQTEEAIKDFQRQHGLTVDGRVGFKTLQALAQDAEGQ